jgi:hypothetical protein
MGFAHALLTPSQRGPRLSSKGLEAPPFFKKRVPIL